MPSLRFSALAATLMVASSAAQVTIAPGSASFVDISSSGNFLGPASNETAHGFTSTVGNDLFPAGPIVVTSNGYVVSGPVPQSSIPINTAIGATTTAFDLGYGLFDLIVCPFWDDLFAPTYNSTLYWQEIGNVLYVQYDNIGYHPVGSITFVGHITFQVQVVAQTCGSSIIHMVYPDTDFLATPTSHDAGAEATVGYVGSTASTNVQWSFNTPSVPSGTSLTIALNKFAASWTSPGGSGSLSVQLCHGAPAGSYQLFATVNAGGFPNGWLFGLDLLYSEFIFEFGTAPFMGPLNASGAASLGPFSGLPSGLSLYSLVFDIPSGGLPASHTPPFAYTIP